MQPQESQVNPTIAEVAQPAQDAPIENKEQNVQETQQEINWKKFRETREAERKAKEAAEKLAKQKTEEAEALKKAMESILNKSQPSNDYQEEDIEEDIVQKKIEAALRKQQENIENAQRQKELAEFPQKLAETYHDFNDVCSTENLDYLEYHYPEIAKPYRYMPDGFDKWQSVYKAVKKFVPNTSQKEKKIAEKNLAKPQSMNVGGVTQTGDQAPQKLDDKRRADNWSRMQRVMKGG